MGSWWTAWLRELWRVDWPVARSLFRVRLSCTVFFRWSSSVGAEIASQFLHFVVHVVRHLSVRYSWKEKNKREETTTTMACATRDNGRRYAILFTCSCCVRRHLNLSYLCRNQGSTYRWMDVGYSRECCRQSNIGNQPSAIGGGNNEYKEPAGAAGWSWMAGVPQCLPTVQSAKAGSKPTPRSRHLQAWSGLFQKGFRPREGGQSAADLSSVTVFGERHTWRLL